MHRTGVIGHHTQWNSPMIHHTVRPIVTAALMSFLMACSTASLNLPPSEDTLRKIEAGMEEKTVRLLAGEPDREKSSPFGATVLYYRESIVADCNKDLSSCVPIVIENGKVSAIGRQWMNAWENERNSAAAKKQERPQALRATPAPVIDRKAAPQAATIPAPPQPADDTQAQIARLEKELRRIPVSRTMDNLKIYRYLLKLVPDNPKYARKVAFYEAQLESDRQRHAENKRLEAERRRRQNIALKVFEGNDRARMALETLGGGKFHIWLENRLDVPMTVTPKHFTLVCTNGARFAVYQARDFNDSVAPGEVIDGRLVFDAYCPPQEIVFRHPDAGRLRRMFPSDPSAADAVQQTPAPLKTPE